MKFVAPEVSFVPATSRARPGAEKTFRQQFLFGGPEHFLRGLPLVFVNRMHAQSVFIRLQTSGLRLKHKYGPWDDVLKDARRIAAFREDGDRAHGQSSAA